MQIFSKVLTDTDVRFRFSFPTHCLQHLDFAGNNSVDLHVKDSCGELLVIRCRKRNGGYDKPELSTGWLKFVADYGLRVGDKVVVHRECRGCAASRQKFHFLEFRKCVWYLSGKCGETRK